MHDLYCPPEFRSIAGMFAHGDMAFSAWYILRVSLRRLMPLWRAERSGKTCASAAPLHFGPVLHLYWSYVKDV